MSNDPVVQILREAYQREKEIAAAPKDSIQSCAQRGGRPRSMVMTRKRCKVVAAAQVKNGVGDVLSTPFLGRTDFYSWVTRTSRTTLPTMARVTAGSLALRLRDEDVGGRPRLTLFPSTKKTRRRTYAARRRPVTGS